jgi:hypothetical protein
MWCLCDGCGRDVWRNKAPVKAPLCPVCSRHGTDNLPSEALGRSTLPSLVAAGSAEMNTDGDDEIA